MSRDLVWSCVVGALLVVGIAEGRAPAPGTVPDKATAAEIRTLQEKRRDLLREALEVREKLYRSGRVEIGGVIETSQRLLATELDLAATGAERISAHEKHLEKAQAHVDLAEARQAAARGNYAEVLEAKDALLVARIGLLKAGGKLKKEGK